MLDTKLNVEKFKNTLTRTLKFYDILNSKVESYTKQI